MTRVRVSVILILVLGLWMGFSSSFHDLLDSFLQKFPPAVAAELQWQNAQDLYNAQLVRANTKMDILAADVQRLESLEVYRRLRWEYAAWFVRHLLDWKQVQKELQLHDSQMKLAQEDLNNKRRAYDLGGVSQDDLEVAGLTLEASKTLFAYTSGKRQRLEQLLLKSLFLTQTRMITFQWPDRNSLEQEWINQAVSSSADIQRIQLQKEHEQTQYNLLSSAGTTNYLAEIARRNARSYDLELSFLISDRQNSIIESYERLKVTYALYHSSVSQTQIAQKQLDRFQEGYRQGVISTVEYYRHLIQLYQKDLERSELEHQFFDALIIFLELTHHDPVSSLAQWIR